MASRGLHEFTVQEADNFEAFGDWYYEELDLRTAYAWTTAANISSGKVAKQVTIYIKPGVGAADTADALTLYLNDTVTASGSLVNDADFNNSETTFVVDDGDDFAAGNVILVNSELMYVSDISTNTLTGTRGYGNSVAVAHADDSIVYKVGTPANHSATSSSNPLIRLDVNNLPFKISGVSINQLSIHNAGADSGDADDYVSVLSFY